MKNLKYFVKEIIVAAVFLSLAVYSVINIVYVKNLVLDISDLIEASVEAGEAGDWDKAIELAERASEIWESHHVRTHLFLRHNAVENAEIAINAHLGFMHARNLSEGYGSARAALAVLLSIRELEEVRFGSVF